MAMKSFPPHLAKTDRLDLLHCILGLQGGQLSRQHYDVVFVAVDFENTPRLGKDPPSDLDFQVGIAILDTRDIHSVRPQELISTHNFALGSPAYKAIASDEFVFGESITITYPQVRQKLESALLQSRNVVFVAHAVENEIGALKRFGIQIENFSFAVFDTSRIGANFFSHPGRYIRLGTLLTRLKCPYHRVHGLHCAGNDAHSTLRALLLLAARTCTQTSENQEMLDIIKDLTLDPTPPCRPKYSLVEKTLAVRPTRKRSRTIAQRRRIKETNKYKLQNMKRQDGIRQDHTANNLPFDDDWAAYDLFDVLLQISV